jgi:heme oxygenase
MMKMLSQALASTHDEFEKSDLIAPRLADLRGYAEVLRAMLVVHIRAEASFQAHAAAFAAAGIDLNERAKIPLLYADLAQLGDQDTFSRSLVSDAVMDLSTTWGWLYVLEGSTLGGAYLAKQVRFGLNTSPAYYGCYGSNTMPMWRAFGTALDTYVADRRQVYASVLQGARDCYQACKSALLGYPNNDT